MTGPANEPAHDSLTHGGLQERRDVLLATTRDALAAGDVATLRLVLNSQHAVDLADLLRRLDDGDRKHSLGLLAESLAAGVLAEFDASTLVSVAAQLDDRALSGIVEQMAPDDAADVLADLSEEHSERILSLMAHGEAQVVRELMKHPEDSGGGIMTSRLVSVAVDATVG